MKNKYRFLVLILILIVFVITPFGILFLIPIPNYDYSQYGNITCLGCDDIYDPTILILFTFLLPIIIFLVVLSRYFTEKKESDLFD